MTSLGDQELPPIASIGDLVKALRLLGVGVGIDESVATVGHELAAAVTMRNPHRRDGETQEAARALRKAIQALDQAAKDAHQHELTAQLLELVD